MDVPFYLGATVYHVHKPQCILTRPDHVKGNLPIFAPLWEICRIKPLKFPVTRTKTL